MNENEKLKELWDKTKKKTSDIAKTVADKTVVVSQRTKETAQNATNKISKTHPYAP